MTLPLRFLRAFRLRSPLAIRHFFLRALCVLCTLCVKSFLFAFLFSLLFSPTPSRAQDFDKPLLSIDEDITSFSISPDHRIVYSVRRLYKTKQYDLQRDDIWLQDSNGKRRRLFTGEKFTHGNFPFSYTVDALRWSPNGRLIAAQLYTTSVVDETGKTEDSPMILLLDSSGKELRPTGGDGLIENSSNPVWLSDNSTVAFLTEAVRPRILYSFRYLNIAAGPVGPLFSGRTFLDSQFVFGTNRAYAIERDRNLSGPPRLQRLDLLAQDDAELATLDAFEGGLSVSFSGKRVAYFLDKEVLEVRDLAHPSRVARIRVGLGVVSFSPDDTHILIKRSMEKKSGDLVSIALPPLAEPQKNADVPVTQPDAIPLLHGLTYRDFAISPDGKLLAVVAPGKRNLLVFPLSGY